VELLHAFDDVIFDIGDVHHLSYLETLKPQKAPQNVFENKRPEVPNVSIVPDRGSACVHSDFARIDGREGFESSAVAIVQA
jgi:hypothetical protein